MQGAKSVMHFSIRNFLYCVGFLSRIPMNNSVFENREKDTLSQHIAYFPWWA